MKRKRFSGSEIRALHKRNGKDARPDLTGMKWGPGETKKATGKDHSGPARVRVHPRGKIGRSDANLRAPGEIRIGEGRENGFRGKEKKN